MAKGEQTTVRVTRKVKIITPKARYSNTPYQYAIPNSIKSRMPVTGQEHIIMTPDKWLGKEKLTTTEKDKLQMGANPFIINPEQHILILHGYEYDNSYDLTLEKVEGGEDKEVDRVYINPKDHAELTAIMAGSESPVAKSKSEYNKTKHHFYVDDKEVEAQKEIDKTELEFDAADFVRKDLGSGRYPELIMFLGYMIPEYKIKPEGLSDTRMKALVLKACKEHPEVVLKYKGPKATRYVFALQCLRRGLIAIDHNLNYKYGDMTIGVNLDAVVEWISDERRNGNIVSKWKQILDGDNEKSQTLPV